MSGYNRGNPPGRGPRRVTVRTNSFVVKSLPRVPFYHYDVVIQSVKSDGSQKDIPISDGKRYYDVMDKLMTMRPEIFTTPRPCFDGKKNLFSTREFTETHFRVYMFPNSNKGELDIKFTRVGIVSPSDLNQLMLPNQQQRNQNTIAITLLQVLVSQAPNLKHNFSLHAKAFFMQNRSRGLPSGLQAWQGFFQSVRPVLNKIIINVDTATAAVYEPVGLLQAAMTVFRLRELRKIPEECERPTSWQKLRSYMRHLTVIVHIPNSNRAPKKQKISDLVKNVGAYTFQKANQEITVEEYFRDSYGYRIQWPTGFGVRLGRDAVYPAELCEIAPGQVYKKKLSPEDTVEFMKSSVQKPQDKINNITRAVNTELLYDSPWMQGAGMVVDNKPLEIVGQELPTPQVLYGFNRHTEPRNGGWNVMNQRFYTPTKIVAWAVVTFHEGRHGNENSQIDRNVQRFALKLGENLKKLGVEFFFEEPYMTRGSPNNVQKSMLDAAKASMSRPETPKDLKPAFVVAVLPQDAATLRRDIKTWGDVIHMIPTVCVRAGKYDKADGRSGRPDDKHLDQYCNNIALKINAKTGGVNSIVNPGDELASLLSRSLLIGCDVSHPSPGVTNRPSVTSVVSSTDLYATRYRAHLSIQSPRQEIIEGLGNAVKDAINEWHKTHKHTFPQHVIVYRDGVSEGEYAKVAEMEIEVIKQKLKELYEYTGTKTELVFIVVGKRHHIRFFPQSIRPDDRNGNCAPGLVIDQDIVRSDNDFYLQSHAGIIGTCRPAHYIVLENTAKAIWTKEVIENMSWALCHVYAAATRSVSIPAPVYYADRACGRAEFHFRDTTFADDNASNASGDFDLAYWKNNFRASGFAGERAMYFI